MEWNKEKNNLKGKKITKRIKDLTIPQKTVIIATAIGIIVFLYTLIFLTGDIFQTMVVISILCIGMPFTTYKYLAYKRTRKMEKYFPDYLRDVSEELRAGVSLPKAIESASRGSYGPLSEEMKVTAAQISWGIPFDEAMRRFADRTKSQSIRRAVTIIIETHQSGGNISEVMETVAKDIKTLQTIRNRRQSKLKVYTVTIYFIFFLFLGIVVALTISFVPATPDLNRAAEVVGGTPSDMSPREFENFFFHLALIEALFSGLIAGQMGTGHVLSGVKHSLIMIVTTLVVFQVLLAPPGFLETVSDQIISLPPGPEGMESGRAISTVKENVTTDEIAERVREKAENQGIEGFEHITGEDLLFMPIQCEPCMRGELEVSGHTIVVNEVSDVPVKIEGKGEGTFDIIIGGEAMPGARGSPQAIGEG